MKTLVIHPGTLPQAHAYADAKGIPRKQMRSARQVLTGALHGSPMIAMLVLHPVTPEAWTELCEAVRDHNQIINDAHRALALKRRLRDHEEAATLAKFFGVPIELILAGNEEGK